MMISASLHPSYFALVMATGIVSVGAGLLGWNAAAQALFAVNVVAYPALWVLTLVRLVRHRCELLADLMDHQRGVGFFTVVAATGVLGVQFVVLRQDYAVGFVLWVFALLLWVVLTYAVFAALTIKENKPSLADGINGGWLVAVVATESISNLGGLLVPGMPGDHEALHFFALAFWLFGGMLYIWMISLIFYRYTFFRLSPSDLMPPYWINMGAMAISTLTGTTLIANAPHSALLQKLLPFLYGFTILFWATATWWIPMLLILAVWRHVYKRFEIAYDPLYWGAVFPIGMYTVSTHRLAQVLEVPFLLAIPRVFVYVAFAAWLAAFVGLLRHIVCSLRPRKPLAAMLALSLAACEPTNQGYAPEQPVKYSHAVHAGGLQIPCQYCHYAAERGRHAGIPPAATCMNCHKQVLPDHPEIQKVRAALESERAIEWVRVHQLPDHAYFDHRAHVTAGVTCQSCHGTVEQMGRVEQAASLTMGWCISCHRQGSDRSGSALPSVPAAQANRLTDCAVCHH